jgi:hypothetical protein
MISSCIYPSPELNSFSKLGMCPILLIYNDLFLSEVCRSHSINAYCASEGRYHEQRHRGKKEGGSVSTLVSNDGTRTRNRQKEAGEEVKARFHRARIST